MGKCDSFASTVTKLWKEYGKLAKAAGATVISSFTGVPPAAITKAADEIERIGGQVVSEWNDIVGNSSLKIGPRSIRLGQTVSGTLTGPGDRTFITPNPMTQDEITFRIEHDKGKAAMKCTICAFDENGKSQCLEEFEYEKGKANDGDDKVVKLKNVLGKIIVINLDGKSVANTFSYEIQLKKARD